MLDPPSTLSFLCPVLTPALQRPAGPPRCSQTCDECCWECFCRSGPGPQSRVPFGTWHGCSLPRKEALLSLEAQLPFRDSGSESLQGDPRLTAEGGGGGISSREARRRELLLWAVSSVQGWLRETGAWYLSLRYPKGYGQLSSPVSCWPSFCHRTGWALVRVVVPEREETGKEEEEVQTCRKWRVGKQCDGGGEGKQTDNPEQKKGMVWGVGGGGGRTERSHGRRKHG